MDKHGSKSNHQPVHDVKSRKTTLTPKSPTHSERCSHAGRKSQPVADRTKSEPHPVDGRSCPVDKTLSKSDVPTTQPAGQASNNPHRISYRDIEELLRQKNQQRGYKVGGSKRTEPSYHRRPMTKLVNTGKPPSAGPKDRPCNVKPNGIPRSRSVSPSISFADMVSGTNNPDEEAHQHIRQE